MALKRELGGVSVFAVAAGAMISSGLFVLPAIAFAEVGAGVFLCYALAALLIVPTLLSKAELMTAMPKAGGTYYFIDRSLGPGLGTVGGVAAWASLAFKSAFALLGIGVLAGIVWDLDVGSWEVKAVACGCCVLFMAVNLLGVKLAGRIQIWLVLVLLVILIGYVAGGIGSVDTQRYSALFPRGWNSLLLGAAIVFVSFGGVTKVATLGEEVRKPKTDLLGGMFAAFVVVGILYVLVTLVTVGLLPGESAQWSKAPLSQAAGMLWSRPGAMILGAAALCAFLTTANAGILAASRTVMAMSQDGLLPYWLGVVGRRRGTPHYAVICTCLFMMVTILLFDLATFAKTASALMLVLFMFELLSVVLMRESRIPTYRPSWRCPLYPWLQVAGILAYAFLLVELGSAVLALAGVILGGAVVWYAFYAKVRVMRESALVHLAARLAAADFEGHDLEAELARVARERDQVVQDRFDLLVLSCPVMDLEEAMHREKLFRLIADDLGPRTGRNPEEFLAMLQKREKLSSTVIRPGLAIPHLIVGGLESLELLLVRSGQGVQFTEGEPPVRVIFALAVPSGERNFYLKALVAIAEIAQNPEFDRRWLEAGSAEALREVVLAAERRREVGQTPPPGEERSGG